MKETRTGKLNGAGLAAAILIVGVFAASLVLPLLAIPGGLALLIYGLLLRRASGAGEDRAAAMAAIVAGTVLLLLALSLAIAFPIVRWSLV